LHNESVGVSRIIRQIVEAIVFSGLVATAILLLSLFNLPPARAADSKPAAFLGYAKYVRDRTDYRVNADGTHVVSHEWALKVLTEQGIGTANQASISFSDRLEDAEIISAYTLKADGRRIEVPPTNFQVESNTGRGKTAPIFSDIRTKTVAFPDVAIGDTVVLVYKVTQKQATFPGNFSMMEYFSPYEVYDAAEVTLSAPESLPVHIYARGVKGGATGVSDGMRHWQWSYRNEELVKPEPGAVSQFDYAPVVVATTFKDYGALATAYNVRAQPKAKVTDAIRKLADELTAGAHTPRDQAKALYEWVATNIEYAPNEVGMGSVVPHEAERVLANRMGDCKDHTTILQSLLAAKGIASTPVLINSGSAYTIPPVATIDIFNHLILYIPSLDLYADSTSKYTPFGRLPEADSDKPVIHTADFAEIRRTPATDPDANVFRTVTMLKIHPDGGAEGETKIEAKGSFSDETRAAMTYLQPNQEDLAIRESIARAGYSGSGTLIKNDPEVLSDSYQYSIKFQLTDMMNLPGPGALPISSLFGGAGAIETFLGEVNEPDRSLNFQCFGAHSEQNYTIHLPQGVEVMALPNDVKIEGKSATYEASYRQQGSTVIVNRELDDHTNGNVCTPAYAKEYKVFSAAVRRNLRAQILYR
jgi:transglutaminase-like putative cysteine protease